MKISQFVIISSFFIGILSCDKSEVATKANIDPAFTSYFNKFIEEGKKRGVIFTEEQQAITIQFSNLPKQYGAIGLTTHETKTIDIIPEWNNISEPNKEMGIFHELGHLMLNRSHSFRQLPNGEYGSLMWTLEGNIQPCVAPLFTGSIRKNYYYDELFNINTAAPDWASENITWKEPILNMVIKADSWNKNNTLDALVNNSPNQVSYKILPTGMSLVVAKTQTVNSEFKLPLLTLFPTLNENPLQNYEVRMRYKLHGRGFELGWTPNNNTQTGYSLISNSCTGDKNYFGISNNQGGYFLNNKIIQNLNDFNDLVLQNKDNYMRIWLNGKLLFQTDLAAGSAPSPLAMSLFFGTSQYDFEFITVTRL